MGKYEIVSHLAFIGKHFGVLDFLNLWKPNRPMEPHSWITLCWLSSW